MSGAGSGHGPEPGMWQQFRRRRVTRTVVLYMAVGFLVVEAYLFFSGLTPVPAWGLRALVGGVVLGFPFAVVLAWTYDVTPSGIVKTPDELGPEPPPTPGPQGGWAIVGVLAVVLGLALEMLRR